MSVRALFGGTFDPIHLGHLKTALALIDELQIDALHLMPNSVPPHRQQPQASAEQRLQMVKLACDNFRQLVPEPYELTADGPSYTAKTLTHFKQTYPNDTLLFVMGMDSLVSLDSWHQWQQLTTLAHLVVMPRSGYSLSQASAKLTQFIEQHSCDSPELLRQRPHGCIYLAKTPRVDISATAIREQLTEQQRHDALPQTVANYIQQQQLYR